MALPWSNDECSTGSCEAWLIWVIDSSCRVVGVPLIRLWLSFDTFGFLKTMNRGFAG